jgi:hypothetical protein
MGKLAREKGNVGGKTTLLFARASGSIRGEIGSSIPFHRGKMDRKNCVFVCVRVLGAAVCYPSSESPKKVRATAGVSGNECSWK